MEMGESSRKRCRTDEPDLDGVPLDDTPPTTPKTTSEDLVFQQNDQCYSAFSIMEEIRKQGKLCDVVLWVKGQQFSAHKIVLAATIPYFKAMFTTDMIEARNKEIELNCIDAIAVEALINFAYTGKITVEKDNIQSIMSGASYFQLSQIRDACADYLMERIHPQNALGFKQFAKSMGCTTQVVLAEKYIELNFKEVSEHKEYLSLPPIEVAALLTKDNLKVDGEEQIFEACMRWVKHIPNQRREHLPQLLALVRLPLMTPVFLTDRVRTDDLIRCSVQCKDLVEDALTYHLIPERGSQSLRTDHRLSDIEGYIYVVGLHKDSTVRCFDLRTKEWTKSTATSIQRVNPGSIVLDGKVYIFGGKQSFSMTSIDVFDVIKKQLSVVKARMVSPTNYRRDSMGVAACDGSIYVCGGYDACYTLNSAERFHPGTNSWHALPDMATKRGACAAIACSGLVYALGGREQRQAFNTVERYDPNKNTWSEAPPMLAKRCRFGVAVLGGKLYACGGYDGDSLLKTVEVFDPQSNKWTYVASMNWCVCDLVVTACMGKLWAVGGRGLSEPPNTVQVYDPQADKWTHVAGP